MIMVGFLLEACDCLEGTCRKEGQLFRLLVGEEPCALQRQQVQGSAKTGFYFLI